MTEEVKELKEPTLEEALAFFKIKEVGTDLAPIFDGFLKLHKKETKENLVPARNVLMRQVVCNQIRENGYFDITPPEDWENVCEGCGGTGELYKFTRAPIFVTCKTCHGDKTVRIPCRSCGGTGKFRRRPEKGLAITVDCNRCDKDHKETVKCRTCRGHGKAKIWALEPEIESTTECKRCRGWGILDRKKAPFNSPRARTKK